MVFYNGPIIWVLGGGDEGGPTEDSTFFEFKVMLFDLGNAPATFQRIMKMVLVRGGGGGANSTFNLVLTDRAKIKPCKHFYTKKYSIQPQDLIRGHC